ncbi:hypothetical protein B0919_04255 [Hymenobacter sp. CRA2]|nr:hypothetical protein B0919_04255 [Hymenobacter sp. CRA2]
MSAARRWRAGQATSAFNFPSSSAIRLLFYRRFCLCPPLYFRRILGAPAAWPGVLPGLLLAAGQAQGLVDSDTTAPDALLKLSTANKGLLPQLTKTQRDAIQSYAVGLFIYQTDNTPGLYIYGGSEWSQPPNAVTISIKMRAWHTTSLCLYTTA